MNKNVVFQVLEGEEGRVDKVSTLHGVPRSVFSEPDTIMKVDGVSAKKSLKVKPGMSVSVSYNEEVFSGIEPENIPLDVIYEDESILVINKKDGMVVHPAAGNWHGTLVNALLYRYGESFSDLADEDDEEGALRPGIVHRLDKDTSGVLIVAKTAKAHRLLVRQFASHTNEKYYIAIAKGTFQQFRGFIDRRIVRSDRDRKMFDVTDNPRQGKDARSEYQVLRQFDGYALVKVRIFTGRTHQIRVHLKAIGHPILGDTLYARKDSAFDCSMMLHALSLDIDHPITKERMHFVAPMPERMKKVIHALLDQGSV